MGGHLGRKLFRIGAVAVGTMAFTAGPMAGTAGAQEVCTAQLGVADPAACVGINSGFGGTLVILASSASTDTLLLAGAACFTNEPSTLNVYAFGKLAGGQLTPTAIDTTIPC